MKKEKETVVNIFKRDYIIKSEEDDMYLYAVARYVEDKMKEIEKSYDIVDTGKLAVLSAFDMARELFEIKTKIENIYKKIDNIDKKLSYKLANI